MDDPGSHQRTAADGSRTLAELRRVPRARLGIGAASLGGGIGLGALVPGIDPHTNGEWAVDNALVSLRNPPLDLLTKVLEFIDGPLFIPWLLAAFIVIGLLTYRRLAGIVLFLVIGGAWLPGHFAKQMVTRARPDNVDAIVVYKDTMSYPSGHMGMAVAFGVGFLLLWWLRGHVIRWWHYGLAVGWALLVGVSRLYAGAHYPLDVLGGGLLALGTGLLISWPASLLHAHGTARWRWLAATRPPKALPR